MPSQIRLERSFTTIITSVVFSNLKYGGKRQIPFLYNDILCNVECFVKYNIEIGVVEYIHKERALFPPLKNDNLSNHKVK